MNIKQIGVTSGLINSKVTQIGFDQKGNTNAQGNCPTTFLDMVVTSRCGTNGDSGGALMSDDGYLIAICTYGSTEHGGKNDRNCRGYSPSAIYMPKLLDVNTWGGSNESHERVLAEFLIPSNLIYSALVPCSKVLCMFCCCYWM